MKVTENPPLSFQMFHDTQKEHYEDDTPREPGVIPFNNVFKGLFNPVILKNYGSRTIPIDRYISRSQELTESLKKLNKLDLPHLETLIVQDIWELDPSFQHLNGVNVNPETKNQILQSLASIKELVSIQRAVLDRFAQNPGKVSVPFVKSPERQQNPANPAQHRTRGRN